jgi:hypothetical protein
MLDDDIPEMLVEQCMQLIKEPFGTYLQSITERSYLSRYMEDSKSKIFIQKGK